MTATLQHNNICKTWVASVKAAAKLLPKHPVKDQHAISCHFKFIARELRDGNKFDDEKKEFATFIEWELCSSNWKPQGITFGERIYL